VRGWRCGPSSLPALAFQHRGRRPTVNDSQPTDRSAEPAPEPAPTPGPGTARGRLSVVVTASLILVAGNLASRVLGWARLAIIGAQFGTSRELDAYLAAFRIPDTIFQLVVAGTLFTAFIPVFVSYRARDDEAEAWRVASSVVNLVVLSLAVLSLLMALFAPWLVPLVAPGFDAPTTELTVRLTRLMLLSPFFIGLGAVVSAILNGYDEFAVPTLAPLVYNLAIIAAAVFLAPIIGVEALAIGVVVGALGHLLVQLPKLLRLGGRYELIVHLRHPGVVEVARLMAPRTLGLAATQANFIISTALASSLPIGSVTNFNYAFQLSQVPVALVGVSVAVALFPTLSHTAAVGQVGEVRRQVAGSLRIMFFVAAPLTAIMVVLHEPTTAVFYQYGAFGSQAAADTANALLYFSLALFAHSWVQVVARAFYALHDSRTPVIWAVVAVAANIGLMLWLVGPMGVSGLALALSISSVIEVGGLLWQLHRRLGSIDLGGIGRAALLATLAATLAGLVMLAGLELVTAAAPGLLTGGLTRIGVLLVLGGAGTLAYLGGSVLLRIEELPRTWQLLRRLRPGS
jgi:putative peptidoglycan lipid II flippase